MPDKVTNGDDQINKVAQSNDASGVSQKAFESFHDELSQEREKNHFSSIMPPLKDVVIHLGANGKSDPVDTVAGGMAHDIKEAATKSYRLGAEADSHKGETLGDLIANAIKTADLSLLSDNEKSKIGKVIADKLQNVEVRDSSGRFEQMKELLKKPEGVQVLKTGDIKVREDDKESLYTPNGDKVTGKS